MAISVPWASLLNPAEEHAGEAPPRQLRELVDGGDDEARQEAIDLLVDGEDRQPLRRHGPREWAGVGSFGFGAEEQHPPQVAVDVQVAVGAQSRPAPRAGEGLQHVGAFTFAGVAGLGDLVGGFVEPVGGDPATDPQADAERFLAPHDRVGASQHLGGADKRGSPLKLLRGEQPQRISHEHRHTGVAVASVRAGADNHLQPADREGEGRQPQIGLGFAAAGGKEEQVDGRGVIGGAFGVRRVGQRRQVEQHEGELKRPPGRGRHPRRRHQRLSVHIRQTVAFAQPSDLRVTALGGHRPVGELERGDRLCVARRGGVGEQVNAGPDAVGDLPGLEDGRLGGGTQPGGQAGDLRLTLVQPRGVTLGEGCEADAQHGRVGGGERVHRQLHGGEGGAVTDRRDGVGHVEGGQPSGLQPVGVSIPVAHVGVHGDVAPHGITPPLPIKQPQVLVFRVVVDAARRVQRVGDGQEHGRRAVERGHRQLTLKQPRGVGVGLRLVLRVDQRELHDPLPGPRPHVNRQPHPRRVRVGRGEADPTRLGPVEPDFFLVRHRFAHPHRAALALVVGGLMFAIVPPARGDREGAGVTGHRERQPHRRRPQVAGGLRGDDVGQVTFGAVAVHGGLEVGQLVDPPPHPGRVVSRAQHAHEITFPRPHGARRELFALPAPRAEQVPPDQRFELVAHLVRGRRREDLRPQSAFTVGHVMPP